MFKGREPLTAQMIYQRLQGTAEEMDERSVQRALALLGEAGLLETVNPEAKPLLWRWPKYRPMFTLPRMSDQEVLAFRLLERFLSSLLPRESVQMLRPYFENARDELERMAFWAPLKQWEQKVRVVSPAQALLPPEPPMPLDSAEAQAQWHRSQSQVRETLLTALFNNQPCQIEYQQLWRDEPTQWTIHPRVFLQRGPAFYLLCTIDEHTDVRQLALHRILSATVLDGKIRHLDDFDVDQEVARCQGMGGSGEPIRLVARFWRPAALHLLETRLATDQVMEAIDDTHYRLTATVNDTAQLQWWLLSFGSKVEVLEPAHLRENMANNAYWMHRMYSQ